eukprot:183719_1
MRRHNLHLIDMQNNKRPYQPVSPLDSNKEYASDEIWIKKTIALHPLPQGLDEEYNLTLEEVMDSRGDTGDVDDELVSKCLKTITKQRNQNLTAGYAQLAEIEAEKDQGSLSKPWMDKKRQMLLMPYTFIYNQQIAESLLMRLTFFKR